MLGWLVAAILGGLFLGNIDSGPDWAKVYARTLPSVLPLQALNDGEHFTVCTVTVIDPDIPFLLGASHCRRPGIQLFIEGIPVRVVFQEGDLMGLVAHGRHDRWRAIPIRQDYPQTGEAIAAIGYAYRSERPSITVGVIANRADLRLDYAFRSWALGDEMRAWIYFNLDLWQGHSGGPIVDTEGRLLTLSSRYGDASVSISSRPDIVREFIEKARKAAKAARTPTSSRSSRTPVETPTPSLPPSPRSAW